MKLKASLFAAVAAVAISPAANAYEGLYGAIGAGLSYNQPDLDTEGAAGLAFDSDADYDNGVGVYTALGYAWGNGFRSELEYSYRQNDVRHISGDGLGFSGWDGATGNLSGELDVHALMVNTLYDFDTGSFVTPYIGFGVGVASFGAEFNGSGGTAGALAIDDSGVRRLAGQGIAGVAFELAENLALDLSYRYFLAQRPEFFGTLAGSAQEVASEYQNHSLFAGLRWNFGAAPPPPVEYKDCWDGSSVPMTSECPPQLQEVQAAVAEPISFTVYFDYDKSNLTPEASNLVREAAARALTNDVDLAVVAGNTDTAGSADYNQRLSERRASVVRDALIANGMPADRIRTEANGENNPAKPTPDGVREPLNRRTEVTITFE